MGNGQKSVEKLDSAGYRAVETFGKFNDFTAIMITLAKIYGKKVGVTLEKVSPLLHPEMYTLSFYIG